MDCPRLAYKWLAFFVFFYDIVFHLRSMLFTIAINFGEIPKDEESKKEWKVWNRESEQEKELLAMFLFLLLLSKDY